MASGCLLLALIRLSRAGACIPTLRRGLCASRKKAAAEGCPTLFSALWLLIHRLGKKILSADYADYTENNNLRKSA